ncbi:MAG TPA: methionyl-tRNA formyltransferase [Candidatus Kapabacteria bacterium]|jgi:methionyl-tRNA formyltransferase|nr:methionyl-tRNA formyltransferase [Candidatus Kapabacteria bacterium]
MMRVIFMGTPEFAVESLRAIVDAGYVVPLVVTTPDRQKGRGLKTIQSDVKRFALERGLEVATPESLKDPGFEQLVRSKSPDVICVVAFRILPESIFSIPSRGSFNLHASLLPKYRGAAPINWALINGETESGVTTFFLRRTVDTGSMILQRRVTIDPETTAGELHDVLMSVGAEAVVETLGLIERDAVEPRIQDDTQATPAPKIFRDDCRIEWDLPAERVHDFIRGLSPHPGAFTHRGGTMVKVLRSRSVVEAVADQTMTGDASDTHPGALSSDGRRLFVECRSSRLEVLIVQPEGRRAMSAEEYLRGRPVTPGERFE